MTTSPFEPNPHAGEERIAAADPGPGAPEPAEGYGPGENEPDVILPADESDAGPDAPEVGDA
ncbi:hypothetical protein [Amycolatopsis sp. NPDC021455]|uniref:hypothetical protein n=1 Tax=Amycolatopsis sp. NPDC021455 TaxID=3154901 RepID=UPI0033D2D2B1